MLVPLQGATAGCCFRGRRAFEEGLLCTQLSIFEGSLAELFCFCPRTNRNSFKSSSSLCWKSLAFLFSPLGLVLAILLLCIFLQLEQPDVWLSIGGPSSIRQSVSLFIRFYWDPGTEVLASWYNFNVINVGVLTYFFLLVDKKGKDSRLSSCFTRLLVFYASKQHWKKVLAKS